MKDETRFDKIVTISYAVLAICVVAFLVYITTCEGVRESAYSPGVVTRFYQGLEPELIYDETAPCGIVKEYRIELEEGVGEKDYFCMYTVHSLVDVYVDQEKLYQLRVDDHNRFIHTPGCVWVMVPLRVKDARKTLSVVVTPVYESAARRRESFYIGSRLDVYKSQLREDLPTLLLCFLIIICGLSLFVVNFRRYWKKGSDAASYYLGLFTFLIGIWKVTDCHFAPLIFHNSCVALSTISIATLSISVFPLINYMRIQIGHKVSPILEIGSVVTILSGMACLILQLGNVKEYRESLIISHVGVVCGILTVMIAGILAWIRERSNPRVRMSSVFLILCVLGATADLVSFYIKGSSASIIFMVLSFLLYILFVGISKNQELVQRANRDLFTGLYNKSRCNELLERTTGVDSKAAFIMIDLNDLKQTNDTLGHEAGDEMIVSFVNILQAEALPGAFLGRYGGDEFIAFMKKADKKQVMDMISRIQIGAMNHNAAGKSPEISYSLGVAFADEIEQPTVTALFEMADERMYVEKKKYHELHDRRGKGRRSRS